MADKFTKTTSSSVLDGKNDRKNATLTPASSQLPNGAAGCSVNPKNVQILTKLANSLSESYQLVKRRQQKYKELSSKMGGADAPKLISYTHDCDDADAGEWQEVKNKLKRKKKLSASLTSVNDSVNQEKRTRIEGMQLNCRGKLHITELPALTPQSATRSYVSAGVAQRAERWGGAKSTVSPSSAITATSHKQTNSANVTPMGVSPVTVTASATGTGANTAAPPPRLKRKLQENVQTIQKLNALTEQLRLEINELKSSLTTERGAVRVLRAQNEAETRKWKNEVKRLQNALELLKKNNTLTVIGAKKPADAGTENLPNAYTAGNIANYEAQRLTNEVIALKEANRALEEKKTSHRCNNCGFAIALSLNKQQDIRNKGRDCKYCCCRIHCDADRRKAADIRTLKDTYEIRLTQLTKSAKTEISRLLEEIKTKERNIGQLKKELQTSQTRPQSQAEVKSRNATTNKQTTNKTTKPKKTTNNNKSKTGATNKISNESSNASISALAEKAENSRDATGGEAQRPNEVKKLKDIELINNTKNLQNNIKSIESTTDNSNDKSTAAIAAAPTTTTTTNATTNEILTHTQNNLKLKQLQSVSLKLNVNVDNEQTHLSNHNNHNNITPSTKPLVTPQNENCNNLLKTTTTTEYALLQVKNAREQLTLPHKAAAAAVAGSPLGITTTNIHADNTPKATAIENMCTTTTATSATTQTAEADNRHHNNMHDDRMKDHNSDSDSALSSAPPSISPQPPPAGLDTADIWQMIRTYSTDLQKLQKDNEILQKENEHLHAELNLAKEHILDAEKSSMQINNNAKLQQLVARVKQLEEKEHQLSAEADELREQNELLEFRILELGETNDKWSVQSHTTASTSSNTSQSATLPTTKNVWTSREDPMQMSFGKCGNGASESDSGITSPHRQHVEDEINLMGPANEELRRRIFQMLKNPTLDSADKDCLQQLIQLVQHLDLMALRSETNSLNTTSCSSDEANSLDLVKSRISDYSSASSPSSARSANEASSNSSSSPSLRSTSKPAVSAPPLPNAARIVATVSPYNSSPQHQASHNHNSGSNQLVPTNTPTDSPRKSRQVWQTNSLSESGVFVESDFSSDVSENNVCTQTDFEEESVAHAARNFCNELQKLQRTDPTQKFGATKVPAQLSPDLSEQKRLQYYKERLALLENKVLIYESSGELQDKRLADRLQREILLEKELKELRDRVEFLESENLTLEEEKCEFEEAENDTRLRLQRLEVELEILSQRNVELEMSREALSAKYKDCRSECLILRDDLAVTETQIRHIEEDKQKAKENLEILHNLLPLLLTYHTTVAFTQWANKSSNEYVTQSETSRKTTENNLLEQTAASKMGNVVPMVSERVNDVLPGFSGNQFDRTTPMANFNCEEQLYSSEAAEVSNCVCQYLKEEVKCLRNQIKDLNSRHYEAMESADCHWVELERQYKDREEACRAKEGCLKSKIQKLQDCLRDDARAANEKICQLEEAERDLKNCLVRVSKEHRDLLDDHDLINTDYERVKEQLAALKEQQKPTLDQLEQEKKRNKALNDELSFMRKLQQETEARNLAEMESMQGQLFELKKEFLHIEVTNSELKEEVVTLEQQIEKLQRSEKEFEDKIRVLQDEVKSKEEMVQKLEKRLERSEGYSLAQELSGSPSKRFKREDVKDLKTASTGLGNALRNFKECETSLPSHQQFSSVARDVKRLADSLLHGDSLDDEIMQQIEDQINEQLMDFHTRRMESEFYCTVYYPVEREMRPKQLTITKSS